MNKTGVENSTDLDAAPKPGDGVPLLLQRRQGLLGNGVGLVAVVVRNGQMLQPQFSRLNGQLLRCQAAVTACGVAVKVAPPRATMAVNRGQNLYQGMGQGTTLTSSRS